MPDKPGTLRRQLFYCCAALILVSMVGCGGSSVNTSTTNPNSSPANPTSSAQAAQPHIYHLEGTIVSIDKEMKVLTVDHKEIPGFMAAMAMPYPLAVSDEKMIEQLGVGDQITADVEADDTGARLRNIVVVKKGAGTKPAGSAGGQNPVGEIVPNFTFVNQDGKKVGLHQYRGKAVLLTFIYTRCPLADYCPLATHNFASIEKSLAKTPALKNKTHLLSISFDPKFDTPEILRNYARSYGERAFDHWEFATLPAATTREVTSFFNLLMAEDGGQITHSMCTAIISPEGSLYRIYHENDWKPADVLADLTAASAAKMS
jgi:protein SCO1